MGALVAREDRIALLQLKASMIKYIDENNFTSWDLSKNIMKWYWNQPKVKSLSYKCIRKAIGCFLFPQWKYSFIKRKKKKKIFQ